MRTTPQGSLREARILAAKRWLNRRLGLVWTTAEEPERIIRELLAELGAKP